MLFFLCPIIVPGLFILSKTKMSLKTYKTFTFSIYTCENLVKVGLSHGICHVRLARHRVMSGSKPLRLTKENELTERKYIFTITAVALEFFSFFF